MFSFYIVRHLTKGLAKVTFSLFASSLFFPITKYKFVNRTTTTAIFTCRHNHFYHLEKFLSRLLCYAPFFYILHIQLHIAFPGQLYMMKILRVTYIHHFQWLNNSLFKRCKTVFLVVFLLLRVDAFSCVSLLYILIRFLYPDFSLLSLGCFLRKLFFQIS